MGIVPTAIRSSQSQGSITHALFSRLFDFAGLFPPAGQSMIDATQTFARHQSEPYAWMLNRFVLPANRIQEFMEAVHSIHQTQAASAPSLQWPLSILSNQWANEEANVRDVIASFAALAPRVRVEAIEQKTLPTDIGAQQPVTPHSDIQQTARSQPLDIYVELPVDDNLESNLAKVGQAHAHAKLRSGGLSPAEFPSAASVVRFLRGVCVHRMGMKATAGLHHPTPASRPASHHTDAQVCPMHGFVHFLLATSVLESRQDPELAQKILEDQDPSHISFQEDQVLYRDIPFRADELISIRKNRFHSIGSCSFEEPVSDLVELGWLAKAP